jgi:hypothetical protein
MPPLLRVTVLTSLAITLITPFLIALVLLLVPGRKGKLRTEREVAHKEFSADQAKFLYEARLLYDGFTIADGTGPLRLSAHKRNAARTETHTHTDKAMTVEIDFISDSRGVRVQIAAWMNDFIFYDSGEGRLIDLTLERILGADLDRDPPPIVPTRSFGAISSLVSALLAIAAMVILTSTGHTNVWVAAVVTGSALACVASMFLAHAAMKEIRRRPDELSGTDTVIATFLVAAVGAAGGVVVLYVRFGETMIQAGKQIMR